MFKLTEDGNMSLEDQIKEIAIGSGADLVGISSKDRLSDHECSDPTYYLPSAESVIGFAVSLDKKILRDFLQKTDFTAQKKMSLLEGESYHKLESIGDSIRGFLESEGYEAVNCDVNMDYRKVKRIGKGLIKQLENVIELGQKNPNNPLAKALREGKIKVIESDLTPYISHRFVGVACGIGRLGWSGNLVTPKYGANVYLGSVVTNAKLSSDPYMEDNPCSKCKVCTFVCQGQFFDAKKTHKIKIGEIEEEIGKKHAFSKCELSCGAFSGQSKYKEWSTWSPWRIDIPDDDEEADRVLRQTIVDYILSGGEKAQNVLRLATDTQLGFRKDVKPVDAFRVTCAFCQLICGETEDLRRENLKIIQSSGVVEFEGEKKKIVKDST